MRIIWLFLLILLGISCNQPTADLTNEISYKQRHTFHPQFSRHDKNPAILVIPERDNVARKLAMAGYVATSMKYGECIDGDGSYDEEKLDRIKQRVLDSLAYLRTQDDVDPERIGTIGYSFGGYFSIYLATQPEELGIRAAVLYSGLFDTPKEISNLRIPILAFLGDADTKARIEWSLAMNEIAQNHHKDFELVIYKNADHGFESVSATGNRAAEEDSWKKTIAFLDKHVKGKHP